MKRIEIGDEVMVDHPGAFLYVGRVTNAQDGPPRLLLVEPDPGSLPPSVAFGACWVLETHVRPRPEPTVIVVGTRPKPPEAQP